MVREEEAGGDLYGAPERETDRSPLSSDRGSGFFSTLSNRRSQPLKKTQRGSKTAQAMKTGALKPGALKRGLFLFFILYPPIP
jgi:hypothetical protein